jgi:hypothetical protein
MWGFFGAAGVGANRTAWIDDIYIDDSSALTYPGDIKVTAKKPAAAGAANAFDTGIGAGANRWDRVNEVPISETNGWRHNASSSQSEQYTLQAAAVGEADITNQAILAICAWLWGAEAASGTGTGEAIWRAGTAVGISLTTTPALYTSIVDTTTYPSTNQAIGMRSSGGGRDVFLYECGMLIAYRTGRSPVRRSSYRVWNRRTA